MILEGAEVEGLGPVTEIDGEQVTRRAPAGQGAVGAQPGGVATKGGGRGDQARLGAAATIVNGQGCPTGTVTAVTSADDCRSTTVAALFSPALTATLGNDRAPSASVY